MSDRRFGSDRGSRAPDAGGQRAAGSRRGRAWVGDGAARVGGGGAGAVPPVRHAGPCAPRSPVPTEASPRPSGEGGGQVDAATPPQPSPARVRFAALLRWERAAAPHDVPQPVQGRVAVGHRALILIHVGHLEGSSLSLGGCRRRRCTGPALDFGGHNLQGRRWDKPPASAGWRIAAERVEVGWRAPLLGTGVCCLTDATGWGVRACAGGRAWCAGR